MAFLVIQLPYPFLSEKFFSFSSGTRRLVVSLYPAGNAVASKSGTIPPFHNRVRGFCHGITPLFLPAHGPGAPLALRHAALCLAKRVYRRGSEAIQTSAAAVQAFQRPQAVSWPHPQALLCRL